MSPYPGTTPKSDGSGPLSTNKQFDGIANDEVEYFATYSTSGGLTWAHNIQVSDGLSSAFNINSVNYGDYTGLSFHDGIVHMAWSDNSNSTKDNPSAQLVPPPAVGRLATEAYYDSIHVGSPTTTVSELIADINRAIARAGIADKVHAVLDTDRLATGGFRISIEALDTSISLSVTAQSNDPAVKDLGLATSKDATGALVGAEVDTTRPDKFRLTSGDAKFSLTITKDSGSGGVTTTVADVIVTSSSTTGTPANASMDDLVMDVRNAVNAALTAKGLPTTDLLVTNDGNALVIKINNNLVTKVLYKANIANDTAIFELGLPNEALIVRSHVSATKDLVPVVGRLENDATLTFRITTDGTNYTDETVTLYADDTASNTTIVSLVDDLNKALSKPAIKTDVLSSFAYSSSDISFGLSLTVNGTTTTKTVTVPAGDPENPAPNTTADNKTLDNLVSDINAAIRTAFLSFGWVNESDQLIVAKSSGRTSALGDARIKLEGVSKTGQRVDKISVQADATNALGLPEDASAASATNFSGRIKAESTGNKLVFSAIESGADGFVSPQITDFKLSANADAADALGLTNKMGGVKQPATQLPADNTDFVITLTTGLAADVFRITLDPTVVKDVQGIINQIALQTGGTRDPVTGEITGNKVTVEINDDNGLTLTDKTFNKASPGPATFMVAPVNGSAAATDLHIVGVDATNKSDRDGKIVGSSLLGGLALLDRFFMQHVQLQATLKVETPDGVKAGANVAIVGVNLTGNASLDARFTVGLQDPAAEGTSGHDDRISIREIGRAFTDKIYNTGVRRLGFLNEATIKALGAPDDGNVLEGADITSLTNFTLSAPATFTLNVGRGLLTAGTDFVVTVTPSPNSTIEELAQDIQDAIDAALASSVLATKIKVEVSASGNGLKLVNNSGEEVAFSDRVALFDRPSLTGLGVADFDVTIQLGGGLSRFITLPNNGHGSLHLATNLGDLFQHWADDVNLTGANPTAVAGQTNKFTLDGDFRNDFTQGARVIIADVGGVQGKEYRTFVDKVEFNDTTNKTTVTVIKGVQKSLDTNGKEVTTRVDLPTAATDLAKRSRSARRTGHLEARALQRWRPRRRPRTTCCPISTSRMTSARCSI
jgi:hypothetical protein